MEVYSLAMSSKRKAPPQSVQTTPKGYEIPVPQRSDVLGALRKVARPVPPKDAPKEP